MMAVRVAILAMLVAVVVSPLLVTVTPAIACSCGGARLADRDTELILVGKVTHIWAVKADRELSERGGFAYDVVVAVQEYLGGRGSKVIKVRTFALSRPACSPFDLDGVGKLHILRLQRDEKSRLITSTCAGSRAVDDGPEAAAEIDSERRRAAVVSSQEPPGFEENQVRSSPQKSTAVGAVLALSFAAVALVAARGIHWRRSVR